MRHLSAGKELFAATDAGLVRVNDQKLLLEHADISGLTVAPHGDTFLSEAAVRRGPAQVLQLRAETRSSSD